MATEPWKAMTDQAENERLRRWRVGQAICNAGNPDHRFGYVHCVGPNCSCWQTRMAQVAAVDDAAAAPQMLEALKEIAQGKGRYSQDRYEHACNTIEDMKETANAAIEAAEGITIDGN